MSRGGTPYADPNAMGEALIAAAADAGIRITLLDTCYLAGGLDGTAPPLDPVQLRFSDGNADAWAERVDAARADRPPRGSARPSTRSAPCRATQLATVAADAAATGRCTSTSSSSPPRTTPCLAALRLHPDRAARRPRAARPAHHRRARHPPHRRDIALLGATGTGVCMCPTTERDLADGIGPARALADAGSPLTLGSDSTP